MAKPKKEPEAPIRVDPLLSPIEATREQIYQRLRRRLITVDGGALDGRRVVTADAILEVMEQVDLPMPHESAHSADLVSPARTRIGLRCPDCGIVNVAANVLLSVQRTSDDDGVFLKVKSKTKPVSHDCGQMVAEAVIDLPAPVEGQAPAFDAADLEPGGDG